MQIRFVIFELLGTLIDAQATVDATLQAVLHDAGFKFSNEEISEVTAGQDPRTAITELLQPLELDHVLIGHVFQRFQLHFEAKLTGNRIAVIDEGLKLLARLQRMGICTAIACPHRMHTTEKLLRKAGLREGYEFNSLLHTESQPHAWPHPDSIRAAMRASGLNSPELGSMLAVSRNMIQAGSHAHLGLIAQYADARTTWNPSTGARPDIIIRSLAEFPAVLHMENAVAMAGQ